MTKTELREHLRQRGVTQANFAKEIGVTPQTVRRWLTNKKTAINPPRWLGILAARGAV